MYLFPCAPSLSRSIDGSWEAKESREAWETKKGTSIYDILYVSFFPILFHLIFKNI